MENQCCTWESTIHYIHYQTSGPSFLSFNLILPFRSFASSDNRTAAYRIPQERMYAHIITVIFISLLFPGPLRPIPYEEDNTDAMKSAGNFLMQS